MELISKFMGNPILYTDKGVLLLVNIRNYSVDYSEEQKPNSNHFITN